MTGMIIITKPSPMTTNIIFLLIGIILGIFAGAWGLPKRIENKVSQEIKKIKGNTAPVDVTMNNSKERVKFLGMKLWRKRKNSTSQ